MEAGSSGVFAMAPLVSKRLRKDSMGPLAGALSSGTRTWPRIGACAICTRGGGIDSPARHMLSGDIREKQRHFNVFKEIGINQIKTKELVSPSEQELVNRNAEYRECYGGLMVTAFEFIKHSVGISIKYNYPYKAKDESCNAVGS
ncbi:hypothetical protein CRG98_002595 [Punica granatum]|uniref:Peptidase C1A papain C-terminal domain-containing protein n=1 Tax=Punica granatum TaxID=22663 RepID=A0A2I0L8R6_PUNGR|nr:hypothetical protein CRG98_002595 [Punica granatum]